MAQSRDSLAISLHAPVVHISFFYFKNYRQAILKLSLSHNSKLTGCLIVIESFTLFHTAAHPKTALCEIASGQRKKTVLHT